MRRTNQSKRVSFVIVLSFLLAFLCNTIPLPFSLSLWRPYWVPMVLLSWAVLLPGRVHVFYGFLLGLMLDTVLGSLLGLHAIGLVVLVYLVNKLERRVAMFSIVQQSLLAGLLLMAYVGVTTGFQAMLLAYVPSWHDAYPIMSSMFLWPVILEMLRRWARIKSHAM